MAKRRADAPERKENRILRYLKEVRAELRKIVWPSRPVAVNLTLIVLGVTLAFSVALGIIDWVFTQLFTLILV